MSAFRTFRKTLSAAHKMKLREIVEKLNLEVKTGADKLDNEVTGGYSSDLLSDVLANSEEGNLWITLQIHHNIVAIASIKDLVGILLINDREPTEDTVNKAEDEGITILGTSLSAFEVAGKLYGMGITGTGE